MKIRYIFKYIYSLYLNIKRNLIVTIYAVLHPEKCKEMDRTIQDVINKSKMSLWSPLITTVVTMESFMSFFTKQTKHYHEIPFDVPDTPLILVKEW